MKRENPLDSALRILACEVPVWRGDICVACGAERHTRKCWYRRLELALLKGRRAGKWKK